MLATSAGDKSKVRRSFSKISTPSKPAAAMARSFSTSSPLMQTVAIEVRISDALKQSALRGPGWRCRSPSAPSPAITAVAVIET